MSKISTANLNPNCIVFAHLALTAEYLHATLSGVCSFLGSRQTANSQPDLEAGHCGTIPTSFNKEGWREQQHTFHSK